MKPVDIFNLNLPAPKKALLRSTLTGARRAFWFLIVLGTIIDPSPSINPARYPPKVFLAEVSRLDMELKLKEGSDILFKIPTYKYKSRLIWNTYFHMYMDYIFIV